MFASPRIVALVRLNPRLVGIIRCDSALFPVEQEGLGSAVSLPSPDFTSVDFRERMAFFVFGWIPALVVQPCGRRHGSPPR